jgi:hypothetical protein
MTFAEGTKFLRRNLQISSMKFGALLAAVSLIPNAAWAEVCDKITPDWDGTKATTLSEALHLFSSLPAVVLILATAIAIRFRSQWGGLAVVCGWSFMTYFFALGANDVQSMARAEGCIGSPTLFIALVAAISVATILYTAPVQGRSDTQEK